MALKASISYSVSDSAKYSKGFDVVSDTTGTMETAQLLAFTKNALIEISDEALKEEQDRGFDKKPVLVVDNRFNRSKYDVNPLGKIEYFARAQFREVILHTYREILLRSPQLTGAYFNHNVVAFNGEPVATNMVQLEAWLETKESFQDKDIIRFINTQPYARRLETLGISKGKKGKRQVTRKKKRGTKLVTLPNGAYHLAYMSAKRKFSKNTLISMDLFPGSKLGIEGPFKLTRFHKEGTKYYGQPYIYPTISIRAIGAGITDTGTLQ